MDFISGLPISLKKKDVIWLIVDRLAKSAYLFLFPLFMIEIHNSYPYSGISCKKLWIRGYILVPHFILIWMVNLNVLVRKQIHGVDLICETQEKVKVIRDSLKATFDRQRILCGS
ncbi:reverse transcriptase [Gossypium australe]|uniref:Reverse transcriptase n=1 Tax=Gossypium australe TaxID=47621 RepID=A0A5B6WDC7_9ROSI|nr:reverse transcriptase [Gossypium australe]